MTTARAPGARRALAPDADIAVDEPVASGGWPARAGQLLLARAGAASAGAKRVLLAAATAALDSGIASLQRLRTRTGGISTGGVGVERSDERRDRAGTRATTARAESEAAAAETVAPKPRRRLRGLLVYLGLMLAGGMGGMALAYDLLAQLLDHRSAEIKRQEIKMSHSSKSVAELKKRLELQEAKQAEAEARLAAALVENEKKLGELQAKRAAAEARLASALGARASDPQPLEDGYGRRGAARGGQAGWTRTGNCTLGSGDIRSVLSGCFADMERK